MELIADKKMTMQEIADALGVSKDSVRNCVRRIMPGKLEQGKTAFFDEMEVSRISMELKQNDHVSSQITSEAASQVKNTTTDLEVIGNAISAFTALQELYNRKEAEYKAIIAQKDLVIEEQRPKADFYDDVTGSIDTIDMKEAAKILNVKGVGRNKLFEILRDKKILDAHNQPYQRYVDAGYFRVVESRWQCGSDVKITLKTVVFQKGLDFIRRLVSE